MRLWLSKSSEVPLREQLVAQIVLGITSDDLKPGQKLPSTREVARRFHIHSNTVSAAYRDLARRGWVEFRKGSGVYVREKGREATLDGELELDQLIAAFFRITRERGYSMSEIEMRLQHWLSVQPHDHFLLIEKDAELRNILAAEIEEALGFPVVGVGLEECGGTGGLAGAAVVAMCGQAEKVRARLPSDTTCLLLHSRSVPESLEGQTPPSADALVAVVSRWPEFLHWSRVMLVAAGLDPAALNFRDARDEGWQKGLRASAFVITDALTVRQLPVGCRPRVFRIISDSSLDELRRYIKQCL